MSNIISGEVTYAQIPAHHWYQPDWIDEDKAKKGRQELVRNKVIYGGASLLSYNILHHIDALQQAAYPTATCAASTRASSTTTSS